MDFRNQNPKFDIKIMVLGCRFLILPESFEFWQSGRLLYFRSNFGEQFYFGELQCENFSRISLKTQKHFPNFSSTARPTSRPGGSGGRFASGGFVPSGWGGRFGSGMSTKSAARRCKSLCLNDKNRKWNKFLNEIK